MAGSTTALAVGPQATLASHGDPFAGCRVGGNGSGLNYRSAEVEPWIADNPANTANLIGSWQQDRWSDGGAKGQVASWSFDAGRSWGQTPQPFTLCAQPYYSSKVLQYERTSDPWVSIGPDGTAYAVSLPFDGDFIRNGLGAAVSRDGGRTWQRQQDIDPLVARADTGLPSDDKQSVTADPLRPGSAYAVWDQLQDIFPPCPAATRAAVRVSHETPRPAVRTAAPAAAAQPCPGDFTAPTYFSPHHRRRHYLVQAAPDRGNRDQRADDWQPDRRQPPDRRPLRLLQLRRLERRRQHRDGLLDQPRRQLEPAAVRAAVVLDLRDEAELLLRRRLPRRREPAPADRRHHPRGRHRPQHRPALRRLAGRPPEQVPATTCCWLPPRPRAA